MESSIVKTVCFICLSCFAAAAIYSFFRRDTLNKKTCVWEPERLLCPSEGWPPRELQPQPTVFVITPTHAGAAQRANLVRLGQTLRWVPNLHWLVVEDAPKTSATTARLLRESCVEQTYLNAVKDDTSRRGRGTAQRNRALQWLIQRYNGSSARGVVFFGDDDNAYDLRLFQRMRTTKRVALWPVGLVGGSLVETPRVRNGTVVGFKAVYAPQRKFAVDMAGFAFGLGALLAHPSASFHDRCGRGVIEGCFISQLGVKRRDVSPLGVWEEGGEAADEEAREVLVWHTRLRPHIHRGNDMGYVL